MYSLLKLSLLDSKQLSIKEIAKELNLSPKQTVRKLKQYEQQGVLTYIPGKGRGNKSVIKWHKNVKQIIKENSRNPQFRVKMFKQLEFEDLPEAFFANLFSALFLPYSGNRNALIVPVYNKEITVNPLKIRDTECAWIAMHLYSRLIDRNGNGDLAYHWEQSGNHHAFYIRTNLVWHNGERMTMAQIVTSLENSFHHGKYKFHGQKMRGITFSGNRLIFYYEGELEELLLVLAQVEFSIQYEQLYSGAFNMKRTATDRYELTSNKNYYLAKPLIPNIILQTIPSQLTRKITLDRQAERCLHEQLEFSSVFYLYYKENLPSAEKQKIEQFFAYFAVEVSRLDDTKKALQTYAETKSCLNREINVGFLVNKIKYIELLKQLGHPHLHVTLLSAGEVNDLEYLSAFDCVIVPLYREHQLEENDLLLTKFSVKIPLYESYRKMYYPNNFIRKGHDLYGYPNLIESCLID
ncbi:SgrR family transcriptional regulator [Solibacillus silvestris]|uniref:SgrR family transcriptional regulator n=1 Tax=Solibacillus silvestris TaxID=76853 RepID=UPI003F7F385B